jgi:fructokinase
MPAERLVVQIGGRAAATAVEAALLRRLEGVVPVAPLIWADPDGLAVGRPAIVTGFVDGVLLDRLLSGADADTARGAGAAVGRALAAIGRVTFERPGFLNAALEPEAIPGGTNAGLPSELLAFARRPLLEGAAGRWLGPQAAAAWWRALEAAAPALAAVDGPPVLVHADFNGKNLLLTASDEGLEVSAVLDWEFGFAGSPLFDVGNLLRFADALPDGFEASFVAAYEAGGGRLVGDWRTHARLLDVFALVDLLERGAPGTPVFDAVLALARARAARGEA